MLKLQFQTKKHQLETIQNEVPAMITITKFPSGTKRLTELLPCICLRIVLSVSRWIFSMHFTAYG